MAEVLNNYHHPLFEVAFQMIDDKEFYIAEPNKYTTTTNGNNRRGVRRADTSVYENHQEA
jgi:hypothetical protein